MSHYRKTRRRHLQFRLWFLDRMYEAIRQMQEGAVVIVAWEQSEVPRYDCIKVGP